MHIGHTTDPQLSSPTADQLETSTTSTTTTTKENQFLPSIHELSFFTPPNPNPPTDSATFDNVSIGNVSRDLATKEETMLNSLTTRFLSFEIQKEDQQNNPRFVLPNGNSYNFPMSKSWPY
jgi:hypothetical protein